MVVAGSSCRSCTFSFNQRQTRDRAAGHSRQPAERAAQGCGPLRRRKGRTHCVEVKPSAKQIQTWRYRCEATGTPPGATRGPAVTAQGSSHVTFTPQTPVPAVTSTRPCPTGSTCVYFFPRGTATPAKFLVGSSKRTQTYTINVEGLTSRVYR